MKTLFSLFAFIVLFSCKTSKGTDTGTPIPLYTPPPPSSRIETGEWGGNGISMSLDLTGGTLDMDCATGNFGAPVAFSSGWSATGTYTQLTGGPVCQDQSCQPQPVLATYIAQVTGTSMHLTIDFGGETPLEFDLILNGTPNIVHCL